jgi:hypothetical protein
MVENLANDNVAQATSYNLGFREGLEAAALIADRLSLLQQSYADACDVAMPNNSHAFVLQSLMARQIAEQIRAASLDSDATVSA